MPILIFSPVQIIMGHPLFGQDEGGGVQKLSIFVHAQNIKTVHTVLTTFPWKKRFKFMFMFIQHPKFKNLK